MGKAAKVSKLVEAHISPPRGMVFHHSLDSVRTDFDILGYWSVVERAWVEMGLDGVLCLDGRPILYLKEQASPITEDERYRLHKLFWNQGVANVLVLADPQTVYIYSGLTTPPRVDLDKEAEEEALVETLLLSDYILRVKPFFHDLATGHYYEKHQVNFDQSQAVDMWLLGNLRALRNYLIEGENKLDVKTTHAFIGRVLFFCYLLDRGIVSVGEPDEYRTGTMLLAEQLESRPKGTRIDFLYRHFIELKEQFNGNMFDQDLEAEKKQIQPDHLDTLLQFLGGHCVESGQLTLGFWVYDFKMIPVETISAIYQDFLYTESKENQRKGGAFYTPRFLAEMVVDTAVSGRLEAYDWSFLDPACGSGIFLVILFNRLAIRWIYNQTESIDYVSKAQALQDILRRQIRGVDKEETACRIACFSLYLAYLDFFDPPDIRNYIKKTGRPLPKLLDYGDEPNRPKADIRVISRADFLADNSLDQEIFDCIIGNPPWVGRRSKQVAQKFMQEAPRYLKSNGVGCLLLPTKILQNQTDAFQDDWLRQVTLERVVQLADYRRLLFENAKTPAFIARFINTPPELYNNLVEFSAPKFNRDGLRKGVITINPSSRTWIPLADILAATQSKTGPVVWKRRLWGTNRDQKLLDLLQSLPPLSDLAGTPKEGKRWIKGQGFQPNTSGKSKNPKSPWWNKSDLYVRADASFWDAKPIHLHTDDCEEIGDRFPSLHRPRDKSIYIAPMVLVSKGFTKVSYCGFDVLFKDSLSAINGPEKDANILMFLAAYLRSNLAKYFLFNTSANWGSEREQIHLNELLRIPFPLPDNEFVSPDAEEIVKQVVGEFNKLSNDLSELQKDVNYVAQFQDLFEEDTEEAEKAIKKQWLQKRGDQINTLQNTLEPLIYRYFGLTDQEIALVEDTNNIFIPSSTPTAWLSSNTVTLDRVEKTKVEPYAGNGLKVYADTLTATLNTWAKAEGSSYCVRAEGGTDGQTGLAMVTVILSNTEASFKKKTLSRRLADIIEKLQEQVSEESGILRYERDLFIFQGEKIYIIRPNILYNWTRTAALNDAARIYGDIALAKEES